MLLRKSSCFRNTIPLQKHDGMVTQSQQADVSIIVATRNRAESLARFLSNLKVNSESIKWEVIVVDNGSSDRTPEVLREFSGHLPLVPLVQLKAGKSNALNEGIRRSRGELLVFTDDDVIPDKDWIVRMHEAFSTHPSDNVFGGRVRVSEESMPAWVRNSYNLRGLLTSEHDKGPEMVRYGKGDYPFGPNLAVRAGKVKGISDPWPVDQGPGTDRPVGDESVFLSRISSADANDRLFVPDSVVYHEVEAENVALYGALRRCYLAGLAHGAIDWLRYTSEKNNKVHPLKIVFRRCRQSKSIRELLCSAARILGFLRGRRQLQNRSGAN